MKSVGAMARELFLRSPFNYDRDAVSVETGVECKDRSLAVQSQAQEADINEIVKRFGLTGQLPSDVRVPLQEDFVELLSYQDALNALRSAQESFAKMPAAIRARFDNDPAQFVEFCSETSVDKESGEVVLANVDEMRKMGLAIPLPPKAAPIQEPKAPVKDNPTDGKPPAG